MLDNNSDSDSEMVPKKKKQITPHKPPPNNNQVGGGGESENLEECDGKQACPETGSDGAKRDDKDNSNVHPLLLPNIFPIVLEHLVSTDVQKCKLVCKTWNDTIKIKSSPVFNPLVILKLTPYLNKASLLACRRVCKLWNNVIVSSPRWNNKAEFGMEPHWTSCFAGFIGPHDFLRFMRKFDNCVFPLPPAINYFYAPITISLNDEITRDFLVRYGKNLRCLNLMRGRWELEDLREVLFEHAPNLRSLTIVCGIIPGTQVTGKGKKQVIPEVQTLLHEDPADFPILSSMKSIVLDMNLLDTRDNPRPYVEQFLVELFTSCPNLETLDMDMSKWYERTWVTDFIAANEQIKFPRLRVLKHLIDPNQSQIINLQMKQFPLTSLRLRIRYRDVTVDALHELLRSLKHTLTDLQLIFYDSKCAHEFPSSQELYKLRRLEIWKYKGQLDFLKDLVGLEYLLIGETKLKGQELFNQQNVFKLLLPKLKGIMFKDEWEGRVFS